MSWYEEPSERSFTLCRSMLSDEKLKQFDKILKQNKFGYITKHKPDKLNFGETEAEFELRWLTNFLEQASERKGEPPKTNQS